MVWYWEGVFPSKEPGNGWAFLRVSEGVSQRKNRKISVFSDQVTRLRVAYTEQSLGRKLIPEPVREGNWVFPGYVISSPRGILAGRGKDESQNHLWQSDTASPTLDVAIWVFTLLAQLITFLKQST